MTSALPRFIADWRRPRAAPASADRLLPRLVHRLQSALDPDERAAWAAHIWWLAAQGHRPPDEVCYRLLDLAATPECKATGYSALNGAVGPDHAGLVLVTNILRKDLTNSAAPSAATAAEIALTYLANMNSHTVHAALLPNIVSLLSSIKPLVRKKSIAALITSLRLGAAQTVDVAEYLRDLLDDSDQGVLNCAAAAVEAACSLDPVSCIVFVPRCVQLLELTSNVLLTTRLLRVLRRLACDSRIAARVEPCARSHLVPSSSPVAQLEAVFILASLQPPLPETTKCVVKKLAEMLQSPDNNLRLHGWILLNEMLSGGNCVSSIIRGLPRLADQVLDDLEKGCTAIVLASMKILPHVIHTFDDEPFDIVATTLKGRNGTRETAWVGRAWLQLLERGAPALTVDKLALILNHICARATDSTVKSLLDQLAALSASKPQWRAELLSAAIDLVPDPWLSDGHFPVMESLARQLFSLEDDDHRSFIDLHRKQYDKMIRWIENCDLARLSTCSLRWLALKSIAIQSAKSNPTTHTHTHLAPSAWEVGSRCVHRAVSDESAQIGGHSGSTSRVPKLLVE